jgi:hypothetical protein
MRVDNWPLILAERVEAWRTVPLVYGKSDCLQFCADVVKSITGENHLDKFPIYGSRHQAASILIDAGGIRPLISSILGGEKPPSFARRGDVVVALGADGLEAAGICLGAHFANPSDDGLRFWPMTAAIAAWTV